VAEAKGLPLLALGLVFMLLLAVAISIAVQVIGVLLIFALMVTPAAIAVRLTKSPLGAIIVSVLVAVFSVWLGLFVAFFSVEPYPASFFIVTTSFVLYVAVRVGSAVANRFVPRNGVDLHPAGRREVTRVPRNGFRPDPPRPTRQVPVAARSKARTSIFCIFIMAARARPARSGSRSPSSSGSRLGMTCQLKP
jgi:hypothetical protein